MCFKPSSSLEYSTDAQTVDSKKPFQPASLSNKALFVKVGANPYPTTSKSSRYGVAFDCIWVRKTTLHLEDDTGSSDGKFESPTSFAFYSAIWMRILGVKQVSRGEASMAKHAEQYVRFPIILFVANARDLHAYTKIQILRLFSNCLDLTEPSGDAWAEKVAILRSSITWLLISTATEKFFAFGCTVVWSALSYGVQCLITSISLSKSDNGGNFPLTKPLERETTAACISFLAMDWIRFDVNVALVAHSVTLSSSTLGFGDVYHDILDHRHMVYSANFIE
ncbi:uncharacterized protein BDR25DRAFT_362462 [Lindgomyces ingoldianus]|uniref:Uncharacterized protein n=1 Tax=Lindgomyces ingoldianus TaxID=673940 RepID=A0ACB6QA75_9PLEO|nr:uncharacterized protein BDR25DRAFT_362462 [Lindgomyces ingoldianus]KAF2463785.1 hypothetical protein BDR25DRAFT_362462 [Lindgomyces ingoldianus]